MEQLFDIYDECEHDYCLIGSRKEYLMNFCKTILKRTFRGSHPKNMSAKDFKPSPKFFWTVLLISQKKHLTLDTFYSVDMYTMPHDVARCFFSVGSR